MGKPARRRDRAVTPDARQPGTSSSRTAVIAAVRRGSRRRSARSVVPAVLELPPWPGLLPPGAQPVEPAGGFPVLVIPARPLALELVFTLLRAEMARPGTVTMKRAAVRPGVALSEIFPAEIAGHGFCVVVEAERVDHSHREVSPAVMLSLSMQYYNPNYG
jgi:hypothetical protein